MKQERELQVMVIDDQHDIRELVVSLLEGEGHKVIPCADGEEAQTILERSQPHKLPDVVLMDVMLPGVPGPALAKRWREHKLYRSIPVVAFTAHDEAGKAMLSAGLACELIRKPFDLVDFLGVVSKCARSSENGRDNIGS